MEWPADKIEGTDIKDWEKLAKEYRHGMPIGRRDPVTGELEDFSEREEIKHMQRYMMVVTLGPKAAFEEINRRAAYDAKHPQRQRHFELPCRWIPEEGG